MIDEAYRILRRWAVVVAGLSLATSVCCAVAGLIYLSRDYGNRGTGLLLAAAAALAVSAITRLVLSRAAGLAATVAP